MRVTLLHNPTAGDAQHGTDRLRAVVAAAGHDVVYRSLKEDDWDEALSAAADLVVVAGGDGAVRKVLARLHGDSVATLLPTGTANNVARTLRFPADDPARLVRGWTNGTVRSFDVCEAESSTGRKRFVESLGGGILGEVILRAERGEQFVADKIERGLRLLRDVIPAARVSDWSVELDGDDLSGSYLAVEAMNVREAGPNVLLAPEADPGDGLLDVVLIGAEHRAALAAYVEARLRGRRAEPPRFTVRRGRRVVLAAPGETPLHADDQLWSEEGARGSAAAEAGVLRVQLLVPSPD